MSEQPPLRPVPRRRLFPAPHPTGWVRDGVFAICQRGMVNLFVVVTASGALAIDSGASSEGIPEALAGAGIAAASVRHVLLTHSDYDHAGGLSAFPAAQVYLGAAEELLVTQQQARFLGLTHVPRLKGAYQVLRDADQVEIDGVCVQAIATPGHTPGSLSYLVAGRWLFAGDAIALRRGVLRPFFAPLNMRRRSARASALKLAQLEGIELVCTGHTGCTEDWPRARAGLRNSEKGE